MSIQDWGAIGELLAAVATVGTLIYLALQIRENSKQLRVTSINALNELINYSFDPIYVSERNTEAWIVGISNPEELSEKDRQLFDLIMTRLMNSFQTAMTQHRHQGLDERDFERYIGVYKGILETSGGQLWLSSVGQQFFDEEALELLAGAKSRQVDSRLYFDE